MTMRRTICLTSLLPQEYLPSRGSQWSAPQSHHGHANGFACKGRRGIRGGRQKPSASRHSFPKSTCTAPRAGTPSLYKRFSQSAGRGVRTGSRGKPSASRHSFPKSTCTAVIRLGFSSGWLFFFVVVRAASRGIKLAFTARRCVPGGGVRGEELP